MPLSSSSRQPACGCSALLKKQEQQLHWQADAGQPVHGYAAAGASWFTTNGCPLRPQLSPPLSCSPALLLHSTPWPAAIAAALSLAVDLVNGGSGAQFSSAAAAAAHVAEQMDYLVTRCTFVRPCAAFSVVSCCDRCMLWLAVWKPLERSSFHPAPRARARAHSCGHQTRATRVLPPLRSRPTAVNLSIAATALKSLAEQEAGKQGASAGSVTQAVVAACEQMLRDDVAANKVRPEAIAGFDCS